MRAMYSNSKVRVLANTMLAWRSEQKSENTVKEKKYNYYNYIYRKFADK